MPDEESLSRYLHGHESRNSNGKMRNRCNFKISSTLKAVKITHFGLGLITLQNLLKNCIENEIVPLVSKIDSLLLG